MAQRASLEAVRQNRIPPQNLDAEQSVLGAMLESKEAIANVVEILETEDFYKPAHTTIYETILALWARGDPVDAITVAEELTRRGDLERIGGKPYIHGLLEAYPTASSAGRYARIVADHAVLRRLIDAGNKVQEIGFSIPEDVSEAVDQAEGVVYEVGNRRLREDIQPIRRLLTENMDAIATLYDRGESVTGVPAGFVDLDDLTAGFQPSNLIIVAARPSMGKSALLGDFALHAARRDFPVVIFSLEMSRNELVQRFLSSEARVDFQRIRKGALQEQDWARLSAALGRLAEAPIFIDDSANVTLMELRAKCRRLKARHGLGLVLIDYLQLMQAPLKSENRQQEVSEISRSLKILARDLKVPVVCASQLNRSVEYRADKRPLLADLRESGCLTAETRVTLASGQAVPISSLVGELPEVVTLDGWKLTTRPASKVWCTGRKPVYRMETATGRVIRATANHPFRMLEGWRALEDLGPGERIAVAGGTDESQLADVGGMAPLGFAPSRNRVDHYAELLKDQELKKLATPDVYWDVIRSIEPDGTADVFDMTVPTSHNFVANGIVAHNSIEQDSDLVMFLYRDEIYNPDTDRKGEAELILAKHRNGPTGIVRLAFMNQYTKFASIAKGLT